MLEKPLANAGPTCRHAIRVGVPSEYMVKNRLWRESHLSTVISAAAETGARL
jgi:hypothetical protein